MMTTVKNLSLVLALALGAAATGCAADSPDDMGGGGGGGGGGGSDDVPRALDASGKYQMRSTFDIATNMPGTVGDVTNAIIAATDGPSDPTDWLLEQIINKTSGTVKTFLTAAKPLVASYLNQRLLQIAPDFVTTMVQTGHDFGDMAKNFGLNETLEVSGSGQAYTSTVTALGVHFKIGTQETDVSFADHQIANVAAQNVGVTLDLTGKLDIAEHKLPLSYGKVLRIGLDEVIIPALDSNATNLQTLLTGLVNCQAVGVAVEDGIYDTFGIDVGPGAGQTACTAGLNYAAQMIYNKLDAIDTSALEFGLVGSSKAVDTNADQKVDKLQTGTWTGTLSYAGTPAPLAAATFSAQRM